MNRIKIFRFSVSHFSSAVLQNDKSMREYSYIQKSLKTEEEIEDIINDFIRGKDIISIKVNALEVQKHNRINGNMIDLVYTILYS